MNHQPAIFVRGLDRPRLNRSNTGPQKSSLTSSSGSGASNNHHQSSSHQQQQRSATAASGAGSAAGNPSNGEENDATGAGDGGGGQQVKFALKPPAVRPPSTAKAAGLTLQQKRHFRTDPGLPRPPLSTMSQGLRWCRRVAFAQGGQGGREDKRRGAVSTMIAPAGRLSLYVFAGYVHVHMCVYTVCMC